MKKTELTLKQMAEAVKANSKEPWNVVGVGRMTWFNVLKRNGTTMDVLRSSTSTDSTSTSTDSTSTSTDSTSTSTSTDSTSTSTSTDSTSTSTSTDSTSTSASSASSASTVPQWQPNVATEANTVGRGGVRYRFTDTEKYNEFVKEDAFRIMERAIKNEITHKPVEREIKPEIPEELLQYDQIDVPYDVWTKYIDESKGEHWGTFVMRYGRWLEPKEHKPVDTPAEPRKVYPKGFLF